MWTSGKLVDKIGRIDGCLIIDPSFEEPKNGTHVGKVGDRKGTISVRIGCPRPLYNVEELRREVAEVWGSGPTLWGKARSLRAFSGGGGILFLSPAIDGHVQNVGGTVEGLGREHDHAAFD